MSEPAVRPAHPLVVVAAALLDQSGRVCMQQRRHDRQHGGLWEFPGGKVEAGESAAQALVREIREELGVELVEAQLEPCGFAAGEALVILLYLCRDWSGEVQCCDAAALEWTTPQAIAALDMPPLDYPLARQLVHYLSTDAF